MNKLFFALIVMSTSVILIGCKSDKVKPHDEQEIPSMEIRVQPFFNEEIVFADSVYTTVEGYDVKFTELKFFFTGIQNNGVLLADAALYDWSNKGSLMLSVAGKNADFSSLSGNLGVGATENHADPTVLPNEHPLHISNAGDMHWDWNPGYIFIKVEARVDTIPNGIPLFDHTVVFHVGKDENMQTWTFDELNWVPVNYASKRCSFKLDLAKFLQNDGQNIDLRYEYSTHTAPGQEALSLKVIQNFKAALGKL